MAGKPGSIPITVNFDAGGKLTFKEGTLKTALEDPDPYYVFGSPSSTGTTFGGGTVTFSSTPPEPEPVDYVKYIREDCADDGVLQAFAEIIEANPAIWAAMCNFYLTKTSTGDGLKNWRVDRYMEVGQPLMSTVTLDIIDKEGTTRARTR